MANAGNPDQVGDNAQSELLIQRQEQIRNGNAAQNVAQATGDDLASQTPNRRNQQSR
jgi:hypothetical protein